MSLERFTRKEVASVGPETGIAEVAELMQRRHVGAVVVVEERRPVGIITDRDLALRAVAKGLAPKTPVREVMSGELVTTRFDHPIDEVLFTMRHSGVRRLPIVDGKGLLVGMVSLDDVLVMLSAELSCGADAVLENRGP